MKHLCHTFPLFLFFIFLLCFAVLGFIPAQNANASPLPQLSTTCQPLDLVFLIDQSDSMGTTDRQNQRIDAVRNLIQRLYEHAGLRCLGIVHRVAVVNFGSTAEVSVELTEISFDSTDNLAEQIVQQSAILSRQVSAPNNLGETRLLAPFQLALNLLDQAPSVDSDQSFDSPRVQAFIVVSDGNPCNPLIGLERSCQSPTWIEHYFQPTQRTTNFLQNDNPSLGNVVTNYEQYGFDAPDGLTNELLRIVPPTTTLHVLLFHSNPNEIRPETNEAWSNITDQFNGTYISPDQVLNTAQITSLLSNLMDTLLRVVNTPVQCGEYFYVEPYAGSALILSAGRLGQTHIRLFDPDDNEVPRVNGFYDNTRVDYIVLPTVERYLINNPKPGRWRIEGPANLCQNITATFETIEATAQVFQQPEDVVVERQAPYLVEAENGYIEFRLDDRLGQPFAALPDFPLVVTGRVRAVGSPNVQDLLDALPDLSFVEQSSLGRVGIWRSQTPVPAPRRGSYSVNVNVRVPSINPRTEGTLINIAQFVVRYEKAPPEDVQLRVIEPQSGEVRPLNTLDGNLQRNQPFQVSANFVRADGISVSAARLFDEPGLVGRAVEAVLSFGAREIERVILEPDTQDPTRLTGEFRSDAVEEERDPEGDYRLEFRVVDDALSTYNTDNYTITTPSAMSTFQHRQVRGVQLNPQIPDDNNRELPTNRIVDGTSMSQDIAVSVALVDQSDRLISPAEVFPNVVDNIVFATLKGPDGSILETLSLSSQGDGIFSGVLRANQETIDAPGRYVIDFEIGRAGEEPLIDSNNFTYLSRIVSVGIQRYEVLGVSLRNTTDSAGTGVVSINTLESDGTRIPQPVMARAQFVNLAGMPYIDPQTLFIDSGELLEALLVDEQGRVRDRRTMNLEANGIYVASLSVNDGDSFDPPGAYTVRIQPINDLELRADNYQLVDVSPKEQALLLREFIGLRLAPQAPMQGATLPLNTVGITGVTPTSIDVAVELQDQDSMASNAQEALGLNDGVPAIRATLRQQGIELRSVDLQLAPGSRSLFTGTIPAGDALDAEGEFSVVFSVVETMRTISCTNANICYQWLNTVSEPVTFRRVEHFGLRVEGVNLPASVPLNVVSENSSMPIGFEVRARITGAGERALPPIQTFMTTPEDAIIARLRSPSGAEIDDPVTLAFDVLTNEFVGQLRGDVTEVDDPGAYQVVFSFNDAAIQPSNVIEVVSQESSPYTIMRYENVGVQFVILSPVADTTQPLNTVSVSQAVPQPVEVVVRLADQDGIPLNIADVFVLANGDDAPRVDTETLENSIPAVALEVRLLDPEGVRIEGPVNLLPSEAEPDRFTGLLRSGQNELDRPGAYMLEGQLASGHTLQQSDERRYSILNPMLPPTVFLREEFVGIVMIPGEELGTVADLNSIDVAQMQRVPEPVEVTLRLQSVNDGEFFRTPADFLPDPDNSITAVLEGPQGLRSRVPMRMESSGVFRARLGSTEQIDPDGEYNIWFEFNENAIDSTQPYQPVTDRTDEILIRRRAITGVRLVPVSGDMEDGRITIPSYHSWIDAYLMNAGPVELLLELQDTEGTQLVVGDVLNDGASVQSAFRITVRSASDPTSREEGPLPVAVEDDGLLRLVIPNSDDGGYEAILALYLDDAEFRDEYVNLSASENTATFQLLRTWDGIPLPLFRFLSTLIGVVLIGFVFNLIRINTNLGPGRRFVYPVEYKYSQNVNSSYTGEIKPRGLRLFEVKKVKTQNVESVGRDGKKERMKLKIVIRPASVDTKAKDANVHKYRVDAFLGDKSLFTNQVLSRDKPINRNGLFVKLK